jgi:hypothetical protein
MGQENAPHPLVGMSRLAKSSVGGRVARAIMPCLGKLLIQKTNSSDLHDGSSDELSACFDSMDMKFIQRINIVIYLDSR